MRPIVALALALAGCSLSAGQAARVGVGLTLATAGHALSTSVALGVAEETPTVEGCIAMRLAADLLPVAGQVVLTDGAVYPPAAGSILPCLERWDVPPAEGVDARLATALDGLLATAQAAIDATTVDCQRRARWDLALGWVRGSVPSIVGAIQPGEGYGVYSAPMLVADDAVCR